MCRGIRIGQIHRTEPTGLRRAIEAMLTETRGATVLGWSIGLEDGGIGLLRYLLDLEDRSVVFDEAALDRRLQLMVRGWEPAVEAELARVTDEKRAAALMERYAAIFPQSHRMAYAIEEAAQAGNDMSVEWHYAEDDDNMQELGEEFSEELQTAQFALMTF